MPSASGLWISVRQPAISFPQLQQREHKHKAFFSTPIFIFSSWTAAWNNSSTHYNYSNGELKDFKGICLCKGKYRKLLLQRDQCSHTWCFHPLLSDTWIDLLIQSSIELEVFGGKLLLTVILCCRPNPWGLNEPFRATGAELQWVRQRSQAQEKP